MQTASNSPVSVSVGRLISRRTVLQHGLAGAGGLLLGGGLIAKDSALAHPVQDETRTKGKRAR